MIQDSFKSKPFDTSIKSAPSPKQEPGRIPKQYVIDSLGYGSNFVTFLCSIFDRYTLESPTIIQLMKDYYLGCTKSGSVIFWQLDGERRVRTGKIMQYTKETGKRVKDGPGIDWVHSKLKKEKVLPEGFNLDQCLFGEHLLRRYPNREVALTESEKSALIGAGAFPEYVWLATGGRSQLSIDKAKVLKGRTIQLFPDTDTDGKTFALWCEKARELEAIGCRVSVSRMLEDGATPEEKEAKIDLADWLIPQLRNAPPPPKVYPNPLPPEEKAVQVLTKHHPEIKALMDELDLQETEKRA